MQESAPDKTVTIVVPILNEIERAAELVHHLSGFETPVIFVDGGSTDGTFSTLKNYEHESIRVIQTAAGRALQMNSGAAAATTDALLFLHADTQLPVGGLKSLVHTLTSGAGVWGRFDVRFDTMHPLLRIVAWFMNVRSAWSKICTGDQGIFMTKEAFTTVGGFPEIALMEDIEISKRLKRISNPIRLTCPVITSARRWLEHGVICTVLKMWRLRLGYWLGDDPDKLVKRYTR